MALLRFVAGKYSTLSASSIQYSKREICDFRHQHIRLFDMN